MSAIKIHAFYDEATHTYSYLLMDPASRQAAIIDSVLDFDPKSGRTATASAEKIVALAKDWQADIVWLLETHVHADHLSAAPYLKAQLGGSVAIGAKVTEVQAVFSGIFNAGERFDPDGRQFDGRSAGHEPRIRRTAISPRIICGQERQDRRRGHRE